jgi:hypothetical protein
MSSYSVMTKIHIWAGMTSQSTEDFQQYFEINTVDRDAGIGASQFDKDVNMNWYDDDLIGVYYSDSDDLDMALDMLPVSVNALVVIRATCIGKGVNKVNALFYYEDAELEIKDRDKKYNGLTYIGVFDN